MTLNLIQTDFGFQVACETLLSGSDLMANLRDTAGKTRAQSVLQRVRV